MIEETMPDGLRIKIDIPRPPPTGNRKQRKRQRARWAEKDRLLMNTVYQRIVDNGLPSELAPDVQVVVQTVYPSQMTVNVSGVKPNYRSMSARIFLERADAISHAIIGHEVSHVRGHHALYFKWGGDWQPYFDVRFPLGEPRLDSSYVWDRDEILAEDIRILFASDECRAEWPSHMNGQIADPRDHTSLFSFLTESLYDVH